MKPDLNVIVNLFKELAFERVAENAVVVSNITFCPHFYSGRSDFENLLQSQTLDSRHGFIYDRLPSELRRWLEANYISYLTATGHGAVFAGRTIIKIRPNLRLETSPPVVQPLRVEWHNARPSRLINPSGFAILDALQRLPVTHFHMMSGLSFAKTYKVSQSALSKIMATVGANNLGDLRKSFSRLSKDWWLEAMQAPRTGRGMTAFYQEAVEYRMHDKNLSRAEVENWASEVRDRYGENVVPGPLEAAKAMGAISDRTTSFWVDPAVVNAMKRQFKLVPIRQGEEPICSLAVPKSDFRKEAITSLTPDIGSLKFPPHMQSLNMFRAVWDLGFAETRAREARNGLLEILLDAF